MLTRMELVLQYPDYPFFLHDANRDHRVHALCCVFHVL